jgi:L-2-hydroxyglutarate oxidase LhgO
MPEQLDCVVVGAGVVGLAIARSLAMAGREVVVVEAEQQIGMHASSRNSEVIHAGLYHPAQSLKARLCVQGKQQLYDYCERHHVKHDRIGKLIVAATPEQFTLLEEIREQAARNGVNDLQVLSADDVRAREPNVVSAGGLFSPSTGIIDSHELMVALEGDLEAAGGIVVLNSEVRNIAGAGQGIRFEASDVMFQCRTLVNSAGLTALDLVAEMDLGPRTPSTACYAKGHYFAYTERSPFNHLVYPVPIDGGLGIHSTNDLGGAVRFGPDVVWTDAIDYSFDEDRKVDFVEAIRRYYPDLDETGLAPSYTGIRPKLAGRGAQFTDFEIQFDRDHGVSGLVNLFGIESPGLTACLAIGDWVRHKL